MNFSQLSLNRDGIAISAILGCVTQNDIKNSTQYGRFFDGYTFMTTTTRKGLICEEQTGKYIAAKRLRD